MIVCPTPPQMNDFCDLLGTPDAPVSKIASVKAKNVIFEGSVSSQKTKKWAILSNSDFFSTFKEVKSSICSVLNNFGSKTLFERKIDLNSVEKS